MKYSIEFKPRAVKDIKAIPSDTQARIVEKIEKMSDNLNRRERLTDSTPEYRLHVVIPGSI